MFQLEIQPTNKMAGTGAREMMMKRTTTREKFEGGREKEMKEAEKVKILGKR